MKFRLCWKEQQAGHGVNPITEVSSLKETTLVLNYFGDIERQS